MTRRSPLHVHISRLFLVLVLGMGTALGWMAWSVSRDIIDASAAQLNEHVHREILTTLNGLLTPAELAVKVASRHATARGPVEDGLPQAFGSLHDLLQASEAMTSIYIGDIDGNFVLLRRLHDAGDRARFNAPPGTRWVLQRIERQGDRKRGWFVHFDEALTRLRTDDRPDYAAAFDPRTRDWFKQAQVADGMVKTAPYLFHTSGKPGVTLAQSTPARNAVVGADMRLETLAGLLVQLRATPGAHLALLGTGGRVIVWDGMTPPANRSSESSDTLALPALNQLGVPVLEALTRHATQQNLPIGLLTGTTALRVEDRLWHATVRPFDLDDIRLHLVSTVPDDELMASARDMLHKQLMALGATLLLAIPATLVLSRRIGSDLKRLAGQTESIRRFDFAEPQPLDSTVLEVSQLAESLDTTRRTIQRFLDISFAVSGESNFGRLLPELLRETISAAQAEAGVLYLAENGHLVMVAGLHSDDRTVPHPPDALRTVDRTQVGPLMAGALIAGTARTGRLDQADARMPGIAQLESDLRTHHGIAVPLLNRKNELVGAMLLVRGTATDPALLRFIEALAASSAVSLESRALIQQQKDLFESFVRLIAGAIDAKSPHTGGHCARVPALTRLFAQAVCETREGPYRDFSLDEDEWEALHIASWLHDCGKITTPEFVIDKGTKLETLYDRIHEVRMRFEVLKRDAQIACLQAIAAGESQDSAQARLQAQWRELDDEFAFVARCNEGVESMPDEAPERLRSIAARTWLRTLDDSLGISPEERRRRDTLPAATLPVLEPLLADRPEHRIARKDADFAAQDDSRGFTMKPPTLLFDRGELHNLSVKRGTLTVEERHKINEHIVQTLLMLGELPFPRHLRAVPEIAGGHHEKMDGSGYPRGLTREQMSPLAKMMAIVDIFEALTAVDRPYKSPKPLSEAIRIMARMKRNGHIDPELFEIFVRSGTWRLYAERFLRHEQIDTVDIEGALA